MPKFVSIIGIGFIQISIIHDNICKLLHKKLSLEKLPQCQKIPYDTKCNIQCSDRRHDLKFRCQAQDRMWYPLEQASSMIQCLRSYTYNPLGRYGFDWKCRCHLKMTTPFSLRYHVSYLVWSTLFIMNVHVNDLAIIGWQHIRRNETLVSWRPI